MNPDSALKDFIHIEKGIIPADLCDYIVKDIKTREWKPHRWYYSLSDEHRTEKTMELDTQRITPELQNLLLPIIIEAGDSYNRKYTYECEKITNIIYQFGPAHFNRYSKGQIMRQHQDHIHSLFDGTKKGIPVLSFVLNLNDDYEGADLFFWDDYIIKLGKGDLVMFPSPFLYPHGVTEATKGTRYSAVTWAW